MWCLSLVYDAVLTQMVLINFSFSFSSGAVLPGRFFRGGEKMFQDSVLSDPYLLYKFPVEINADRSRHNLQLEMPAGKGLSVDIGLERQRG